jgi:hypothetical protein
MRTEMLRELEKIANVYHSAKDQIGTEEATKTSLILPFIRTLGFDPFDPLEVAPEIVADIGSKKGEKLDYALKSGSECLMLVECKKCTATLGKSEISQLYRYFGALKGSENVRIGILTNGLEYLFFTDLDKDNVLDHIPFFSIDIRNLNDQKIDFLQQFTKSNFNVETIIDKAGELKRRAAVVGLLESYLNSPTDNLVTCILADMKVHRKSQQLIATYTSVIKEAFKQLISNKVEEVLRSALKQNTKTAETDSSSATTSDSVTQQSVDGIISSPEEIEAYAVVKSILRDELDISRITFRDLKGSSSIILDNSNRKIVVKLYFNDLSNKRIILFNDRSSNKENPLSIDDVFDIYNHADAIKETVRNYLTTNQNSSKQGSIDQEQTEQEKI